MVHLIHYELKGYRPGADYDRLIAEIKSISNIYCHLPESTWLVETEMMATAIASRLDPLTHVGDPLFVTRIYRDWGSYSLTAEQTQWLSERNFGSTADAYKALVPFLFSGSSSPIARAILGTR